MKFDLLDMVPCVYLLETTRFKKEILTQGSTLTDFRERKGEGDGEGGERDMHWFSPIRTPTRD